jgi:phenylpropionate dioxygenase-like ring-hydroxylating dioxygenase large terminal subunit
MLDHLTAVAEDLTAAVLARLDEEDLRDSVPDGFPHLPDMALGRYTDPDYYAAEMREVFHRSWLFAGHESELPEPGSYIVADIPFAPVLLVRAKDGVIRAFLNACRHRGAPVVGDCAGKVRKNLVCGFHSWTYDLTGQLIGVTEKRDFLGLDKEQRSLTSLRCETWGGYLFVTFDADAEPLLDWLGPVARRYSDLMTAPGQRLAHKSSVDVRCNWKVAVESFMETYHIKTIHAQSAAVYVEPRRTSIDLYPRGHSSMYLARKHEMTGDTAKNRQAFHPEQMPELEGLPEFYKLAPPAVSLFPNLVMPLSTAGFPIIGFWPLGLDRTRIVVAQYGPDWGDGPRPAGWEKKIASFDILMEEDVLNLEPMQHSIEAAAHKGIPLSYQERRIWHLNAEITRLLGAENVPEPLAVPDLLRDYVVD